MKRAHVKFPLAALIALTAAMAAWAFYAAPGSGNDNAAGTTGTLNAATISVPTASTGSHAITWDTQASLSDSSKNGDIKYRVQRKLNSGGFANVPDGDCSGDLPRPTTSCTDTVTTAGSYTYRVLAKYSGWTALSNEPAAVVVTLGGATAPAAPTSVALANGGGAGSAYINDANKGSVDVTVGLGTTSLATDTVHVTISDGTHTTTDKTAPATTGSGSATVTGIDASALDDGSVTLRATSSNATGTSPEKTAAVTKDAAKPVSSASSSQYATSAPIVVDYTATDAGGSGVKEVELWARKTGGSFAKVDTDTDPSSASFSFTPTNGEGTYEFYTRARDNGANYEDAPGAADDSTVYDATAPAVVSIERSSGSVTADAASVQWLVTYSENVNGVDADDFQLATTGVTGASITGVSGSGATRTVTASTGSGSGTIGLAALENDTVTDNAGNNLQAGLADNAGWRYTIDKPSVVSINRASAENPTNDASVSWTVTFSEPVSNVNIGSNSDLALVQTGSVAGSSLTSANPVGGSTPATSWTVVASTGNANTAGSLGLNLTDNDSITDAGGNRLGGQGVNNGDFTGQTFTIDKVAPGLQTLQMFDDDANGLIDRVDAVFDEALETSGANVTTGWSSTGRPGGIGNVSAVGVTGSTATLTFAGGSADNASTAVGNFTITLSSTTGQIRDALGNKSGFSQSPTDKAGPVPRLLADTDGSSNGLFQVNDTLTVTFTEDLLTSYSSDADATLRGGTGGANDDVTLPGGDGTFMTLGRTDYISGDGSLATFSGASAARAGNANADRPRLLITLGSTLCSGACASLTQAAGTGNFTFKPDPAVEDAAGNDAHGSRTQSIRLF